jgi:hypothetical protein
MKLIRLFVCLAGLLGTVQSRAEAILMTYDLTGLVERFDIVNPEGWSGNIFGIEPGQSIHGFLTLDLDQPIYQDAPDSYAYFAGLNKLSVDVGNINILVDDQYLIMRENYLEYWASGNFHLNYYLNGAEGRQLNNEMAFFLSGNGPIDHSYVTLTNLDAFQGSMWFTNDNGGGLYRYGFPSMNVEIQIDSIRRSDAVVPEPASLSLVGMGLVAIFFARKKEN